MVVFKLCCNNLVETNSDSLCGETKTCQPCCLKSRIRRFHPFKAATSDQSHQSELVFTGTGVFQVSPVEKVNCSLPF